MFLLPLNGLCQVLNVCWGTIDQWNSLFFWYYKGVCNSCLQLSLYNYDRNFEQKEIFQQKGRHFKTSLNKLVQPLIYVWNPFLFIRSANITLYQSPRYFYKCMTFNVFTGVLCSRKQNKNKKHCWKSDFFFSQYLRSYYR
jgi:hypothetical protein